MSRKSWMTSMSVTVTQNYRQTFRGSVPFPILHAWSTMIMSTKVVSQGGSVTLEHPCITCLAREQAVSSEHTHLGLASQDSWVGKSL